jgi:hypothetical protein
LYRLRNRSEIGLHSFTLTILFIYFLIYIFTEISYCNSLLIKPKGKRLLGRQRHRWYDNVNMDLKGVGLEGVVCINVTKDRDGWRAAVCTVMNLRVSHKAGNFLLLRGIISCLFNMEVCYCNSQV